MISLFIRSYSKDFEWLKHSVKSMQKNLLGIADRVLAVPTNTYIPSDIRYYFDKIVYIDETHEGYVQQQIDKIRAYKYCQHDHILFSDSDCVYYEPFDANCRLDNGKIILPKTKYSSLSREAQVWKDITYMSTLIDSEYEYMRCLPLMHHRKVLEYLDNLQNFQMYVNIVKDRELSEFNAIGALAEVMFPELYTFIDTETTTQKIPTTKQYWSWGGITEDIAKELKQI